MAVSWTEKWYSIFLPLFPIFILYGFDLLPFVTFSDYMLMLFIFTDVIAHRFKLVLCTSFLPLVFYLLLHPLLLLLFELPVADWEDAIGSAWKLALYIFGMSLLAKDINRDVAIKSIRIIGAISTVYAFLQFALGTFLHISITPYIPFFPVLREGLLEQQDNWIAYGWTVRPRAWFSEPSTFAIFLLLALLVELFVVKKQRRKKKLCWMYLWGILISHSSTGIAGLLILLVAWFCVLPNRFFFKIKRSIVLSIIFLIPLGFILLVQSGYIDSFIDHTFASGQGIMAQSHFADISSVFENMPDFWGILFGHGMQNIDAGYLPGWPRTYYCLGLLGVLLYGLGFALSFKFARHESRIVVLTFIALNLGTEIMLGVFMLLYMSVAWMPFGDEDKNDEVNPF